MLISIDPLVLHTVYVSSPIDTTRAKSVSIEIRHLEILTILSIIYITAIKYISDTEHDGYFKSMTSPITMDGISVSLNNFGVAV